MAHRVHRQVKDKNQRYKRVLYLCWYRRSDKEKNSLVPSFMKLTDRVESYNLMDYQPYVSSFADVIVVPAKNTTVISCKSTELND